MNIKAGGRRLCKRTLAGRPRRRPLPLKIANTRSESAFHVDTFDLYSARQRTVFLKQASEELGVETAPFPASPSGLTNPATMPTPTAAFSTPLVAVGEETPENGMAESISLTYVFTKST